MKAVISIGYQKYVMPTAKASKIMDLMSHAVAVQEEPNSKLISVFAPCAKEIPFRIEMEIVADERMVNYRHSKKHPVTKEKDQA